MSRRIGIGIVGFGWMGQAHARSCARIPSLFHDREFEPELVIVSDLLEERAAEAVRSFGADAATADWHEVVGHTDVDVVYICVPNTLHVDVTEAAAAAGKHVFCEKPVGGTPAATARIHRAARDAGVITGVGYNYRWAPLVRYTKELVDGGRLGEVTAYRGRFFSMYGQDPLGLLTWRYRREEAGYGASADLMSHALDLALMLVGPISAIVGTAETFVRQRPLPPPGRDEHYGRGRAGDSTDEVTNEDYCAALAVFAGGARGTFEASRALVGPQSQMAFDLYGTEGAVSWNFETMNELRLFTRDPSGRHEGYTTVYSGERFPYHGRFVPGNANAIGYEDLKVIEDYEFLSSVAAGRPHEPGFDDALEVVRIQSALVRSWDSGKWESVADIDPEPADAAERAAKVRL
jgi:predicted dehydrogenase